MHMGKITKKTTKKHMHTCTITIKTWIFNKNIVNFQASFTYLRGLLDHCHDDIKLCPSKS